MNIKINIHKLIFILGFLVFTIFIPLKTAQAHVQNYTATEDKINHSYKNLDKAIGDVLVSQKKENIKNIDCSKISAKEFEAVGEAWMDYKHPGLSMHRAMDNMMGGEGTKELAESHASMGKQYLGCENENSTFMGNAMGSMSMFSAVSLFFVSLVVLNTALFTVLLVILIYYLIKKIKKEGIGSKK